VLTRTEFDRLDTLTAEPNIVFTRRQLLDRVWGGQWYGDDHVIDVHVGNLRRKTRRRRRPPALHPNFLEASEDEVIPAGPPTRHTMRQQTARPRCSGD
jgi:Transcriptional regulatory protein, C terminal